MLRLEGTFYKGFKKPGLGYNGKKIQIQGIVRSVYLEMYM